MPLFLIGSGNVPIWYRLFLTSKSSEVVLCTFIAVGVTAGLVTPPSFRRFAVLCLIIPAFVLRVQHHDVLSEHLLRRLLFPPFLVYFLLPFVPLYIGYSEFFFLGHRIRKFIIAVKERRSNAEADRSKCSL